MPEPTSPSGPHCASRWSPPGSLLAFPGADSLVLLVPVLTVLMPLYFLVNDFPP